MEKVTTTTRQKNILYVDSDKELIRSLKDYLESNEVKEKYSLNFIFAGSTKEALKKIAESQIDLIILEIMLPVVNGYYFLNAIKKDQNNIPVIVYTKLKGPQDMAKLAASEVENIFIKQLLKMEDLIQMVAKNESLKANLDKVVVELQNQIKALSESEAQNRLKVVQCPRCSMILTRDSHFCNNCGQQIFKKTKSLQATVVTDEKADTSADTAEGEEKTEPEAVGEDSNPREEQNPESQAEEENRKN